MANRVELIFEGDDKDLVRAFDNIGDEAKGMAADIDKSTGDTRRSFGDLEGGIDSSEQKFRGLGDTINGTGDIMEGLREGNIVTMAAGFADLAGGMTDFLIPAMKAVRSTILTSLAPAFTLIAAHPLIAGILAGGAIIAGLIFLEKKFGVVTKTVGFLKDALDAVLGGIGAVIRAFRDLWNNTIGGRGFTLGGIDLPGPLDIPAVEFRIPRLHTGGRVPGRTGADTLAVLQAGEQVVPNGGGRGSSQIVINVSGVGMGRDFGQAVADALRENNLLGVG